jgi:hypothetical protein
MADDQSDSRFSRRDFLEVSSGALAGAGVTSVANMFPQDQSSNGAAKPASGRDGNDPGFQLQLAYRVEAASNGRTSRSTFAAISSSATSNS